jgi:hypothetical protein
MGNQDSAGVNNPSIIRAANGSLEFGGGNSWNGIGGTFASSMMIADNGNVGIGTASPIDRLDIAGGRIRFLGDYTTPTDGAGYIYKQSIGTTVSGYQDLQVHEPVNCLLILMGMLGSVPPCHLPSSM